MSNPYQSPVSAGGAEPESVDFGTRWGRHVPVVGVLLIVQGALDMLMGLLLTALAVAFPIMLQTQPPSPELTPSLVGFVTVIYGGLSVLMLAVGLLSVIAGWRNYHCRGRTLGIIALACGSLTLVTCYCLPTSLCLMIYGLIVYLSEDGTRAFAAAEAAAARRFYN